MKNNFTVYFKHTKYLVAYVYLKKVFQKVLFCKNGQKTNKLCMVDNKSYISEYGTASFHSAMVVPQLHK